MTSAEKEKALQSETRAGGFLAEQRGGTGPGPLWESMLGGAGEGEAGGHGEGGSLCRD